MSVSNGRRLILMYNLFHSTLGPDVLRAGSNKSMAKLDRLFSYWKDNIKEETSALAHLLDDVVADDALSYGGLEGSGLQVVTYLRQAAEKYGFCVYLADMERTVKYEYETYDYYDTDWKEVDQSDAVSTLTRVVELDGFEVAKGMQFSDDMYIQEDVFADIEPDENDTGTLYYNRTVRSSS